MYFKNAEFLPGIFHPYEIQMNVASAEDYADPKEQQSTDIFG